MVGTGEINPVETAHGEWTSGGWACSPRSIRSGGPGEPWEVDTGGVGAPGLENAGIYRIARHPAARAGANAGATQDVVVAATTNGLYVGRRQVLPAVVGPPTTRPGRVRLDPGDPMCRGTG